MDRIQLRKGTVVVQPTQFGYDLAASLTEVYHGYDPYNHVGADIAAELIDKVAYRGDTDLPHGADKPRDDTEWPGPISAEKKASNNEVSK